MPAIEDFRRSVLLLAGLALAGCGGGDGLPRERVSGSITLGGAPLEAGDITFTPATPSGTLTAVAGLIQGGSYSVPGPEGPIPGEYKVGISSTRPDTSKAVGKPAAGPGDGSELPMRELVPARYNTQTTLKVEVTKGGKNSFDFALEAK